MLCLGHKKNRSQDSWVYRQVWDDGEDPDTSLGDCLDCMEKMSLFSRGFSFFMSCFFLEKKFIDIQLLYNVVLVSDIQQSDSVKYKYNYFFFKTSL